MQKEVLEHLENLTGRSMGVNRENNSKAANLSPPFSKSISISIDDIEQHNSSQLPSKISPKLHGQPGHCDRLPFDIYDRIVRDLRRYWIRQKARCLRE